MELQRPGFGGTLSAELARCLPTPIRRLQMGAGRGELWLKDDGLTGISYGGNKLRKLPPIIADACARDKRRIVTVGAAGSHHVLATTLFAARQGLRTAGLLFPQLATPHVRDNLRASIASGLEVIPLAAARDVPAGVAKLLSRRDAWVAPGAMGTLGAAGFADAVAELAGQVARRECPEPDAIILPLGSGSSAAGLLVGIVEQGMKTRVVAVNVSRNPAVRPMVLAQASALMAERASFAHTRRALKTLTARLHVEHAYAGGGYGVPSRQTRQALKVALTQGMVLEHTYTGKAFAAALAMAHTEREQQLMFWNTLSSASLEGLLRSAPPVSDLPQRVRRLLQPVNLESY